MVFWFCAFQFRKVFGIMISAIFMHVRIKGQYSPTFSSCSELVCFDCDDRNVRNAFLVKMTSHRRAT